MTHDRSDQDVAPARRESLETSGPAEGAPPLAPQSWSRADDAAHWQKVLAAAEAHA